MSKKTSNGLPAVSAIEVWGYKSIRERQRVELAPLTILAGANSSGKSSLMQPILLLKQTQEVGYDPGVLLLDGPNVRFSSVEQLFSKNNKQPATKEFGINIQSTIDHSLELHFGKLVGKPLDIRRVEARARNRTRILTPNMSREAILEANPSLELLLKDLELRTKGAFRVCRDRFLLTLEYFNDKRGNLLVLNDPFEFESSNEREFISSLIHLPGLRGNPTRSYPVTAIGQRFPGTFEAYTASMIAQWQATDAKDKLAGLAEDMQKLGLTWKVEAKALNDTQVELLVGRLPRPARGGHKDLVSIADVGVGVSQTLPVLVALHAARKGQPVYLEQPEIHLHPKAQLALAEVLASAIKRGVRVIVETHSAILLLGLQTLVAQEKVAPSDIQLHWFTRNPETGWTQITSTQLDESGAFGDWPVDFGDVSLAAESAYLNAADEKLLHSRR